MKSGRPLEHRTPLAPSSKQLKRSKPLAQVGSRGERNGRRGTLKQTGFTPASVEQRERVAGRSCLACGHHEVDAAHCWPRGMGGCSESLCVIPLCRPHHRAFDDGKLDVLGDMLAHGLYAEIGHAVEHARGDLVAVLHRLTTDRYEPVREAPRG